MHDAATPIRTPYVQNTLAKLTARAVPISPTNRRHAPIVTTNRAPSLSAARPVSGAKKKESIVLVANTVDTDALLAFTLSEIGFRNMPKLYVTPKITKAAMKAASTTNHPRFESVSG